MHPDGIMAANMLTMSEMHLGYADNELGQDLKADSGETRQRDGLLVAMTSLRALRRSRTRRFLKRIFDVVVAGVALLLALPIAVFAALAIKLSSPGGVVLVREVRVGRDGEHFELLKLRTATSFDSETSRTDASEPDETHSAASGGQRVTVVGRILRTCSIDELPVLWNVLRGDMSVVGPQSSVPAGRQRTPEGEQPVHVRPGLTGEWSSSNR